MKLIRTTERSVWKKALRKNPYHRETSELTNNTNQTTGHHTTRAYTESHFGTDIIICSKILLSKRSHHTKACQLARNANQSTHLHMTRATTKGHFQTD